MEKDFNKDNSEDKKSDAISNIEEVSLQRKEVDNQGMDVNAFNIVEEEKEVDNQGMDVNAFNVVEEEKEVDNQGMDVNAFNIVEEEKEVDNQGMDVNAFNVVEEEKEVDNQGMDVNAFNIVEEEKEVDNQGMDVNAFNVVEEEKEVDNQGMDVNAFNIVEEEKEVDNQGMDVNAFNVVEEEKEVDNQGMDVNAFNVVEEERKVDVQINSSGHKSTNIASAKTENIYITVESNSEKSKIDDSEKNILESSIIEITEDLNVPKIDVKEIKDFCKQIQIKRIGIVNCLDVKSLHGVQNEVVKIFRGYDASYKMMAIISRGNHEANNSITIETFEELPNYRKGKKMIVFLETSQEEFTNSLLITSLNHISNIRVQLKVNNIIVVCLLDKSTEEVRKINSRDKEYVSLNIDSLKVLLDREIGIEKNNFISRIKNSKFVVKLNEREVFERIKDEIENGDDFSAFVNQLDEEVLQESNNAFKKLKEHFNSGDYLIRIVFFAGTYFSNLTFREFDEVVKFLIGKKTIKIREKIPDSDLYEITEISLLSIWNEENSEIIEKCNLVNIIGNDGNYIIDFEQSDFRRKFKAFLEKFKYPFLQKEFDKVKETGLLFDFKLSPRISKNIVRLTVEYSKFEKDFYNKDWLVYLVNSIRKFTSDNNSNLNEGNPYELLAQIWDSIHKQSLKLKFNSRLAELIREMYIQDSERFSRIVDDFIKTLINKSYGKASLDIVLEVSEKLQHNIHFDATTYLKHLIHQGKDIGLKQETYRVLFQSFELDDLKVLMNDWLPEEGSKLKNDVNLFGLRFQVDYCILKIVNFPIDEYGKLPSKFFLFEELEDASQNSFTSLKHTMYWLFQENTEKVIRGVMDGLVFLSRYIYYYSSSKNAERFNDYNPKRKTSIAQFYADIIESWFHILYGVKSISEDEISEDKLRKIHDFLHVIFTSEVIDVNLRGKIIVALKGKISDVYGYAIKNSGKLTKNIKQENLDVRKKEIKEKRTILGTLISEITSVIKKNNYG